MNPWWLEKHSEKFRMNYIHNVRVTIYLRMNIAFVMSVDEKKIITAHVQKHFMDKPTDVIIKVETVT